MYNLQIVKFSIGFSLGAPKYWCNEDQTGKSNIFFFTEKVSAFPTGSSVYPTLLRMWSSSRSEDCF